MADGIIGQLFSKTDADKEFGEVLNSVQIESERLRELITKSESVLMFQILGDQPVILGSGRVALHPDENWADDGSVFRVASISVIKSLLVSGGNSITYIEQRKDVMSITNGEFTLERTADCPPYC